MKRVLLVEDETHKREEIKQCLLEAYGVEPEVVDGVSSAVVKVMDGDFDLVVLDMALSTFGESASDRMKGHDQAQGGTEVLRALKARGKAPKILIVTQYPDFHIGTLKVKLKDAPKIVRDKYSQNVIGAVLYHYKSKSTMQRIVSILRAHQ